VVTHGNSSKGGGVHTNNAELDMESNRRRERSGTDTGAIGYGRYQSSHSGGRGGFESLSPEKQERVNQFMCHMRNTFKKPFYQSEIRED
jgi:hypothetical protein